MALHVSESAQPYKDVTPPRGPTTVKGHAGQPSGSPPGKPSLPFQFLRHFRGCHLRIEVPLPVHRLAVFSRSGRRVRRTVRRKRLLIRAVVHPDLLEDGVLHELRKRLPGNVHHQLLLDFHSAARVTHARAGNEIDADGRSIGRLFAIEDLRKRWQRLRGRIPRKPVHGQSRGVAHRAPQGDLLVLGELVFRTFQDFSFSFTSSSSESFPCSTSESAPAAATGLEIDPAWKSVVVVTDFLPAGAVAPKPRAPTTL